MRHVILGAGPSGVIAAETIRKHAPHDEVIVIGDEPEAPTPAGPASTAACASPRWGWTTRWAM